MRVPILLLLAISSVMLDSANAKDVAGKVLGWIKDNCSVSVGFPWGASVNCNLNGKKRQAEASAGTTADYNYNFFDCSSLSEDDDGINKQFIDDLYDQLDENKNGFLSDAETAELIKALEIVKDCLVQKNSV